MQFSHFRVQLLHSKARNYLLIIYFITRSLIFQDSYMRSAPSSVAYSGHLDVYNRMTTFVRAFNVPAHSQ